MRDEAGGVRDGPLVLALGSGWKGMISSEKVTTRREGVCVCVCACAHMLVQLAMLNS